MYFLYFSLLRVSHRSKSYGSSNRLPIVRKGESNKFWNFHSEFHCGSSQHSKNTSISEYLLSYQELPLSEQSHFSYIHDEKQ